MTVPWADACALALMRGYATAIDASEPPGGASPPRPVAKAPLSRFTTLRAGAPK